MPAGDGCHSGARREPRATGSAVRRFAALAPRSISSTSRTPSVMLPPRAKCSCSSAAIGVPARGTLAPSISGSAANVCGTRFGTFSGLSVLVGAHCRRSVPFLLPARVSAASELSLFSMGLMVGAPRFELGTPSPPD